MVENENKKDNFPDFGYRIILLVISLPAGMIVGRWLPQMILPFGENGFDIHVIVAIISASLVLQLLLFPFRKLLSAAGTLGMLILVVMLYNGQITKADLLDSYWRGVSEITNHDYGGKSMDQQIGIQAAIADDNGIVQFVNQSKFKYKSQSCFPESILTSFSLFDEISCQWNYKNDPKNRELFRPVSETIRTLTGDCDDHAICLASCMKESGARARIIHTDGHLYPELYIGKNKDKKRLLTCLKEIYPSALFQKLYTNNDDGELWLSMDYTESYPGGKNLGKYKLEKMELE